VVDVGEERHLLGAAVLHPVAEPVGLERRDGAPLRARLVEAELVDEHLVDHLRAARRRRGAVQLAVGVDEERATTARMAVRLAVAALDHVVGGDVVVDGVGLVLLRDTRVAFAVQLLGERGRRTQERKLVLVEAERRVRDPLQRRCPTSTALPVTPNSRSNRNGAQRSPPARMAARFAGWNCAGNQSSMPPGKWLS